ncbi:hypothetical protein [Caudoviricetes sp.]|nr:hypothetical protein [Caudoviricetes sp.]
MSMTNDKQRPMYTHQQYVPSATVADAKFVRRLRGLWLSQNTKPNRHHRRAESAGFWDEIKST